MTLAATLDLATASERRWDAVVVGAGPAGALAARELACRGVGVLLVDRAAFPRWKVCGCCLNARSLATLAAVGLGELLGRCRGVALTEVRLAGRGCRTRVALPAGAALSREAFDAALIEAAVEAGAAFLPETRASLGPPGADQRQLTLCQRNGQAAVSARVVFAADGLPGGLLAHEPGFRVEAAAASRIGAGVVSPTAPEFYAPGTIFMACGRGGYLGLVRLEDGRLDLAAAFEPAALRQAGGPGPAAAHILDEAGWPPVPAIATLPWRGTPALTRRALRPAAERVFVLGDAAGYVEPFTGEGIAWALASAAAVAPLAARAVRGWTPALADEWAHRHREAVISRQRLCRAAAGVLRHPEVTRAVIRLLACLPGLAGPVVRRLNAP
jgi:menaquinone-9 beta-reductase